ncbi:hypothetical protein Y032_0086g1944 [Ancylostoma ceylanicum]|uniref:Uncharacterized protein n=1 Tax=Ancylostoma ceylanicum TaxID=53326 RepID=A0A016TQI4_9BILA|nr:hypothetical protein Y032_0086g1944 [Ancylostoma ceylanicum]
MSQMRIRQAISSNVLAFYYEERCFAESSSFLTNSKGSIEKLGPSTGNLPLPKRRVKSTRDFEEVYEVRVVRL